MNCLKKREADIAADFVFHSKLIHSADPQTRPVVIIIFTQISVRTFQNIAKQNKRRVKIMITSDGTVGLAEWIIDDFVFHSKYLLHSLRKSDKLCYAISLPKITFKGKEFICKSMKNILGVKITCFIHSSLYRL